MHSQKVVASVSVLWHGGIVTSSPTPVSVFLKGPLRRVFLFLVHLFSVKVVNADTKAAGESAGLVKIVGQEGRCGKRFVVGSEVRDGLWRGGKGLVAGGWSRVVVQKEALRRP